MDLAHRPSPHPPPLLLSPPPADRPALPRRTKNRAGLGVPRPQETPREEALRQGGKDFTEIVPGTRVGRCQGRTGLPIPGHESLSSVCRQELAAPRGGAP